MIVHPAPWHGTDEQRFDETVRPHLERTLRMAKRLIGCDDLAWDATQETLLTLWNTPEQPANLSAWLMRTVRNRSLHLLRTHSRRRVHERQAAGQRPECSLHDEPCAECQRRELLARLETCLPLLPREQREVFELCDLQEKDYVEAAAQLGVPVGTNRSRLHRARQALARALHTDEAEPRQQAGCPHWKGMISRRTAGSLPA